jgi:outer membrane protein
MGNKTRWLALSALLVAGAAQADALVRVRAIEILPDASSEPVRGVDVENKLAPDVDLSWFFNKNLAVELLLTIPQSHKVTLNDSDIGDAQHLPPSLLLQYHAPLSPRFQPYAGAGLNYTFFTDRKLDGGLKLEKGSFGPALQVGFDVPMEGGWVLNFDVKKIWIDADVTSSGSFVTHVEINPLVVGAGVGYRFR